MLDPHERLAVTAHIRAIEALVHRPVVTVVLAEGPDELAFVVPAEADDAYVRRMADRLTAAAQDASN